GLCAPSTDQQTALLYGMERMVALVQAPAEPILSSCIAIFFMSAGARNSTSRNRLRRQRTVK
ncbi:MAG: hypothetical protein ACM3WS_03370, partial [Bacillota bacterium]